MVFIAALALALGPALGGLLRGQLPYISDYISATLSLNYFQFGAIRRGLGPSIAYVLGPNPRVAFAIFYIVNLVLCAAVFSWAFSKIRAPLPVLLAFAVVLADLLVFWRFDAGRTDVLVAVLLVAAAIAVAIGRLT
ncbi:MAG TPA: hypothetical protein VE650_04260, partial [Acetobacteraceae bacterium]|nr:hypothetical protein [Acetobacteraceae bacterium]